MAKRVKMLIDYDDFGDMLNVFVGKPYDTDNVDIDHRITLRFNFRTKKLVGLIILQFSLLFPKVPPKSRALVAEAIFNTFERLYSDNMLKGLKAA